MSRRLLAGLGLAAVAAALLAWRWWASPSAEMPAPPSTPPLRIASLTLGTDEILSELVSAERVVGVTLLVDDPEISNVPGFYPPHTPRLRDVDAERIIGLHPDLICVASYNSADFLKVMERSGLPVYRNEACHGIDEIEAGILALGRRLGASGRAESVVGRMRQRRQRLAETLGPLAHRPRVLYWSAGFTAGRRTTMDDLIREAGGVNTAADLDLNALGEISPERVLAVDPDIILLSRWAGDEQASQIERHPLLRNLRAVREKRVVAIAGRYLTSVSQFVVEGAERLARRLHPERFAGPAGEP